MASMEHPIFSISTRPDRRIRRYESPDGEHFIEITPSVKGLATVHDRDVLIFCISQIMAALNDGRHVSKVVRFKAHDLLTATNRGTDGRGYEQLKAAFDRLAGTRISTNIITGEHEVIKGFGLITDYEIVRETRDGRMIEIEIILSNWVFNAIRANEVLTLHRGYFRLRKPLERRLYEIARKHCGQAGTWRIGLDKLKLKCGSNSTDKEFKRLISKIVQDDSASSHIPDYAISMEPSARPLRPENIVFRKRSAEEKQTSFDRYIRSLDPDTIQKAKHLAPGWDIYAIEQEWRNWMIDKPAPDNLEAAFMGFCRKWYAERGEA